jgi:polysaccharide biosynthesis/export protein
VLLPTLFLFHYRLPKNRLMQPITHFVRFFPTYYLVVLLAILNSSCASYQNNILFRTGEDFDNRAFDAVRAEAEKNYRLNTFDQVTFQIFSNGGEVLVEPNQEFSEAVGDDVAGQSATQRNRGVFNPQSEPEPQFGVSPQITMMGGGAGMGMMMRQLRRYNIMEDGTVLFPKIGEVQIKGLTLRELDTLLMQKYAEYYVEPYVITRCVSRRVIVMGAMGSRILPLRYDNTTLIEILAATGELTENVRTNKVRLLRNADIGKPALKNIDLSTWEGIKDAELVLQPNDIIYIEPRRRPFKEFVTDLASFTNAIGSTFTILLTTLLLYDRFSRE